MRTIPVRAAEAVGDDVLHNVEIEFGGCQTLADLMHWTAEQTPRAQIAQIVTQDEYTHDVILPYGPNYLSFDTN
jgi:hypothetical protein